MTGLLFIDVEELISCSAESINRTQKEGLCKDVRFSIIYISARECHITLNGVNAYTISYLLRELSPMKIYSIEAVSPYIVRVTI